MSLDLNIKEREETWQYLIGKLEDYYAHTVEWKATPTLDKEEVISFIERYRFDEPLTTFQAIDYILDGFKKYHVHTPHPHYMGLFNPRANYPSIVGDTIAATINPQMAAWSHAPFGIEVENFIVRELGKKFGLGDQSDGIFTSGGAEANLTAVCCALQNKFPGIKDEGLRSLPGQPRIYCSTESHHSIQKASVITGLGTDNVVPIEVDGTLSILTINLEKKIISDLDKGFIPAMVVATAGTTGAGGIDDLRTIKKVADRYDLWMHTDAAYGGACALTERFSYLLEGINKTDSITFDAHKWLSVPMGAGIFLTPHKQILRDTFDTITNYMPKEATSMDVIDPYTHSIQWSRRFTALKLYMSLLVIGWDGYKDSIEGDFEIGFYLREKLKSSGWEIYNHTQLPILCFNKSDKIKDPQWIAMLVDRLIQKGQMWLSVYPVNGIPCARACITNYNTRKLEIDVIVDLINKEVEKIYKVG